MTSKNSLSDTLSDRYAIALFDLASDEKCIEKIIDDCKKILTLNKENKDFNFLLKSPLISSDDKFLVLTKILTNNKSHSLLSRFIAIIKKNKRFNFLIDIIIRFNEINNEKRGNVIAHVISAEELNSSQKKNLINELNNFLGKVVTLNFKIDKSIIGGLIIKIGSKMIDASIFTKINKLKLAMKESRWT